MELWGGGGEGGAHGNARATNLGSLAGIEKYQELGIARPPSNTNAVQEYTQLVARQTLENVCALGRTVPFGGRRVATAEADVGASGGRSRKGE